MDNKDKFLRIDALLGQLIADEGYESITDSKALSIYEKEFTAEEIVSLKGELDSLLEGLILAAHNTAEENNQEDDQQDDKVRDKFAGSDDEADPYVSSGGDDDDDDDEVEKHSSKKSSSSRSKGKGSVDNSEALALEHGFTEDEKTPGTLQYLPSGEPKKPSTSYFIFTQTMRAEVKKQNPGLPEKEVIRKLGELWTSSDVRTKALYTYKAKVLKNLYDAEMTRIQDDEPELYARIQQEKEDKKQSKKNKKDKQEQRRVKAEQQDSAPRRKRESKPVEASVTIFEAADDVDKMSNEELMRLVVPVMKGEEEESVLDLLLSGKKSIKMKKNEHWDRVAGLQRVITLIAEMNECANIDAESFEMKQPAMKKLTSLAHIMDGLKIKEDHDSFLKRNGLLAINAWLEPYKTGEDVYDEQGRLVQECKRTLVNEKVRSEMYRVLSELAPSEEHIMLSKIGMTLMDIYNSREETGKNKRVLHAIITQWTRLVVRGNTNLKSYNAGSKDVAHASKYDELLQRPKYPVNAKMRALFPQGVSANFVVQPGSRHSHDNDEDDVMGDEAMEVQESTRTKREGGKDASVAKSASLRHFTDMSKVMKSSKFMSGPNINSHKY